MAAGPVVRLLGAVQFITNGGDTLDLPSVAQRRLLAVLALASGTTLRPEYLSDLLELSPGALRTAVSRLRGRLGEAEVVTDAAGYRIGCAVDAMIFTGLLLESANGPDRLATLDAALAMWNGNALDEFRHESWARADVSRLEELRSLAIEDRAELLIARSRASEAVAALETHIAANPLRDRPRGLLIEALANQGRQADALRAYQDYHSYLAEEIGTEPSDLVRSIERRVAAGTIAGPAGERQAFGPDADDDVGPAALPTVPLHGVLARGPALIGRTREMTAMQSELARVREGSLRVVLVSGEAGIGKTTLLGAFARAGCADDAGPLVLYGRCDEGAAVPLEPFRGIVGALVEHAPTAVLRAHCERSGGEILRIAPHLASRVWAPPPTTSDDATERFQLFEAVADLVRRLARAVPIVLIVDDMHWAEPTALQLLRHLCGALRDTPVLLVAGFRDTGEHQTEEFRAAVTELVRLDACPLALSGFDDAELSRLVASVVDAPSAPLLAELRSETAGNPLYAAQLVRHLVESGHLEPGVDGVRFAGEFDDAVFPRNVLDVVWTRVRALGPATAEVLGAASVLGLEFTEETLIEIAEPPGSAVAVALDAAVTAGLLAESSQPLRTLRFTHALVARSLYAELDTSERRRLHRRCARVLQKSADELPQSTVVELARHWALAGDVASAQQWATVAGDYALEHLAPSEAAAWYRTALDHAVAARRPDFDRAALLVRLGEALDRVGDPEARATLREAARMARSSGADDVLVRAALAGDHGLAELIGVDDEGLATIEAALAVADQHDTATYARLLAKYAHDLVYTPRAELRQRVARQALDLAEASDDPTVLPQLASGLTFALWGPGTLPFRREVIARAVAAAVAADDPFLQFWASRAEFFVSIESADPVGARQGLERMRAIAERVGEPRLRWVTAVADGFTATMEARFADAERHAEFALELGTQIGETDAFPIYLGVLYAMRSFAGRYDELEPLLEAALKGNPDFLQYRLAYALAAAVGGRREAADEILREGAADGFASVPADHFWMTTIIGCAVLAIELGDAGAAAQLYPILEPFGCEVAFNGATSQGYIGAYLGKLASLLGQHDLADEHLRRSLDVATSCGWVYHRATTLVAMALSQRRRTGALDADANAWLDEAMTIATERGLNLVAAQAAVVRG